MEATFEHPKPSDVTIEFFLIPLQQLTYMQVGKINKWWSVTDHLKTVKQSSFKFDVMFRVKV